MQSVVKKLAKNDAANPGAQRCASSVSRLTSARLWVGCFGGAFFNETYPAIQRYNIIYEQPAMTES